MPSLKSRLAALLLRHTRKKAFASAEGMNRWIAAARLNEDHRPPVRLSRRVAIRQRSISGRVVYEVLPLQEGGGPRILYLHGGAFVFELSRYHWQLIAEMAERLGSRITVPVYPLAPEHGFDDIFGFGMDIYRRILGEERPQDIVFMGDSAGGNMAVVMTMMAAAEGLPSPGAHVLISPGLDMTLANPDLHALEERDPWLGIPGGLEAIRHYARELDRADWRISPLYGDLSVLPPTLLLTGTHDILCPDCVIFADRARQAGVEVELEIAEGMFHDWVLVDLREAHAARDRIVAFLRQRFAAARPAIPRSVPS
ncbi:MAG: alpha/beta hydrolase [Rhizobiaceae bacterium]